MALQLIISLILRKRSNTINQMIQVCMTETQQKIQMRQNQFMRKPASQKVMMAALEKEQNNGIERVLEILNLYKPLYRWNFMLKKQVNTMRLMFLYQQKKMNEVDALMPDCLFFDAQSISIKLARLYSLGKLEDVDRFFKKKCRRMKKDDMVLPYSLYAWILVKQERIEDAIKVLATAKDRSSNEVVIQNWENLVNGRIKHFSNAKLGEIWYALGLEIPKMPKMQQQIRYR